MDVIERLEIARYFIEWKNPLALVRPQRRRNWCRVTAMRLPRRPSFLLFFFSYAISREFLRGTDYRSFAATA